MMQIEYGMKDILTEKYIKELLVEFPSEHENLEFMFPNTFTGSDHEEYLINHDIFHGKLWHEIDLAPYKQYKLSFLFLTEEGIKYYLPALLKNFYNLEHVDMIFYSWLITHLHNKKYEYYSYLTPQQSKLVAMFLVNAANLEGGDTYAQNALTSYWGNFLLF